MAVSAISGPALADLLGRWPARDGPLYRLLADRIASLADHGELPAGLRLPPERELAQALSVSRNTAAAAYQLLREEGLAETRQGAGTTIAPHRTTPAALHRANGAFAGLLQSAEVAVDLTLSVVDCAPQVAAALEEPASVLGPAERREVTAATGYHPLGLPALRAAAAGIFGGRPGLATSPEQVLVTTGGQQAIDLLMRALVIPGQPVVVEDPTFPGVLDALHRAGARPVGVPAAHGLDAGRLAGLVRAHAPALVYLILTHHNPTGRVASAADRERIAALAAAHPATVFVEDMTLAELALDPAPAQQPLAAYAPGLANVVTIGSLSKVYWGGLRTGWIRAAVPLISRLAAVKATSDLGSPAFGQAIAAALMTGQHDSIVTWRTGQLRARREALCSALHAQLPSWSWVRPPGGLTLWVQLPDGADGGALAQAALRRGVGVIPGRLLSATDGGHNWVRIAYTQPPAQLDAAAALLAQAWAAARPRAARQPAGR